MLVSAEIKEESELDKLHAQLKDATDNLYTERVQRAAKKLTVDSSPSSDRKARSAPSTTADKLSAAQPAKKTPRMSAAASAAASKPTAMKGAAS